MWKLSYGYGERSHQILQRVGSRENLSVKSSKLKIGIGDEQVEIQSTISRCLEYVFYKPTTLFTL